MEHRIMHAAGDTGKLCGSAASEALRTSNEFADEATFQEHDRMTESADSNDQREEQEQLARDIGEELTEAFIAYVRGDVAFEDLSFGVYDALSDLHVIASGDYELSGDDEEDVVDDSGSYDEETAIDEQETLSQEPA